jgi:hypothetical protein
VALHLVYQHRVSFPEVAENQVVIRDELVNTTQPLDVVTKQPLPTPVGTQEQRIEVELRRIDGTWKVVDVWLP